MTQVPMPQATSIGVANARLPRLGLAAWLKLLWRSVLFASPADTRTAVRWPALSVLVILPGLMLYANLGHPLFEPDEGRYAQIPRELYEHAAWLVPTMQGEPYLDKPPLFYWLVALSYRCFGVSISAARLVPALAVHLTILLVYLIGQRSVGERAAFRAGLLLSLSPGFLAIGRLLLLDGVLTLCVTVSLLCAFEAVRTGQVKLGWWLAAAFGSGCGFLTKGPIAEVLLFPPLFAFAWLSSQGVRVGWWRLALFALIMIGVNLPWYIGMYLRQPEFLKYFFWEHNVMRFVQPFDHLQPVWFYVPILLACFVPGWVVGVGAVRRWVVGGTSLSSSPASVNGGFWWLAGLWCLFFFTCSGSKLPTYILPAYPPLCLAFGEVMARSPFWTARRTAGWFTLAALFMAGLLYLFIPWYAMERSPLKEAERVRRFTNAANETVVTYPRPLNSVAFAEGRSDFACVKIKDVNQFFVDCHFRPRTVVLFTTANAYEGMKNSLPASLRLVEHETLQRSKGSGLLDKLAGSSPWGLCDIAIVEPVELQYRAATDPNR